MLYKEIITTLGIESLESIKRTLREPKSAEDVVTRLELFFEELLSLLFENYAQTILILREVDFSRKDMADSLKVFIDVHAALVGFFTHCQKKGFVVKRLAPDFIASFVLNHISNQIKTDELNKKYSGKSLTQVAYRRDWIDSTISLLLNGCLKQ